MWRKNEKTADTLWDERLAEGTRLPRHGNKTPQPGGKTLECDVLLVCRDKGSDVDEDTAADFRKKWRTTTKSQNRTEKEGVLAALVVRLQFCRPGVRKHEGSQQTSLSESQEELVNWMPEYDSELRTE